VRTFHRITLNNPNISQRFYLKLAIYFPEKVKMGPTGFPASSFHFLRACFLWTRQLPEKAGFRTRDTQVYSVIEPFWSFRIRQKRSRKALSGCSLHAFNVFLKLFGSFNDIKSFT